MILNNNKHLCTFYTFSNSLKKIINMYIRYTIRDSKQLKTYTFYINFCKKNNDLKRNS